MNAWNNYSFKFNKLIKKVKNKIKRIRDQILNTKMQSKGPGHPSCGSSSSCTTAPSRYFNAPPPTTQGGAGGWGGGQVGGGGRWVGWGWRRHRVYGDPGTMTSSAQQAPERALNANNKFVTSIKQKHGSNHGQGFSKLWLACNFVCSKISFLLTL